MEEVADAVEVAFHDESDALGVERRAGEVAVVGLVIDLEGEVAVRGEEVAYIEVADERGRRLYGIVAVAELAVDEQAVVEHSAADESFVFGIVPPLVSR